MRKLICTLVGAAALAIVGFFISSGLSYIYEMKFADSQDSMNSFAVFLILFVIPAFALVGGFLGRHLYHRYL